MSEPLSINMNLSDVKVAFPLVAHDSYAKWRVSKVSTDTKTLDHPAEGVVANGVGTLLKIEYDLVEPVPDSDGNQIIPGGPGAKFFESINLYSKTDAKDKSWFIKKICDRVDALLGTSDKDNKKGKPERPPLSLAEPNFAQALSALIMGQTLTAKMKVSTYEGTTRNEFAKTYFPADLAV